MNKIEFEFKSKNKELSFKGDLGDEQTELLISSVLSPALNPNYLLKLTELTSGGIAESGVVHIFGEEPTGEAIQEKETIKNNIASDAIQLTLDEIERAKVDYKSLEKLRDKVNNEGSSNWDSKDSKYEQIPKSRKEGMVKVSELGNKLKINPEKVSEANRDFHSTGVKYNHEGRARFRAYYECPRCNHNGRHYIPRNVNIVSCHECQAKLEAIPATDKGFGFKDSHRDDNGNFFTAFTLRIDDDEVYERDENK